MNWAIDFLEDLTRTVFYALISAAIIILCVVSMIGMIFLVDFIKGDVEPIPSNNGKYEDKVDATR